MACLIRLDNGQIFNIGNKIDIIGRGSNATIFLDDEGVSRNHAEVFMMSGWVEIIDLNSRNGIFVNDERIRKSFLNDGDKIAVGSVQLVFSNKTVEPNQTINVMPVTNRSMTTTHYPVSESSISGTMELVQIRPDDSFLKTGTTELNHRYLEMLFNSSLELSRHKGTDKVTNVAYVQIQRVLMPSIVVIKLNAAEMLIEKPMGSMNKISQQLFEHCLSKGIAFLRRKISHDSANSAVICVPILDSEKNVRGAIYIESAERNYELEDMLFVRALASQVSQISSQNTKVSRSKISPNTGLCNHIDPEHLLIHGASDPINKLKSRLLELSVKSEAMVSGPPGTNRRIVANNIHHMSNHSDKALIYVDCSSLNPESIHEILFGRSGLPNGKFHKAEGGTLFLNRITYLPTEIQDLISAYLKTATILPVSQSKPVPLGTQLIIGIRGTPEQAVANKRLNQDLLDLFKGKRIHIPRLSERQEDIPQIVTHLFNKNLQKYSKPGMTLHKEAKSLLSEYSWPGNDRELELVMERAVLLCDHKELTPEYLFLPL